MLLAYYDIDGFNLFSARLFLKAENFLNFKSTFIFSKISQNT
jgi:hypothetical protein